jgi:Putative transposase of IS4/5 family (DUF4096)
MTSASARKRRGSRVGSVAIGQTSVIQTPKLGARIMRYELADYEWAAIKPMLPNKPRGVPRVNDRRVLNGIFWVLRSGAPWRDVPDHFGPYTTCYNRFVRWRRPPDKPAKGQQQTHALQQSSVVIHMARKDETCAEMLTPADITISHPKLILRPHAPSGRTAGRADWKYGA